MTKPSNLVNNDFLTDLGTDYVAIATNGHPVGRADTLEALKLAVPDAAHYLTAADLADEVPASKEEIAGEVGKEAGSAETPVTDADKTDDSGKAPAKKAAPKK